MFWYIFLLVMICLDFGLEWFFKKKGMLNNPQKTFQKALVLIFKYRLISIVTMIFMSTFKAYSVGADNYEYEKYLNILEQDGNLFKRGISNKLELAFTILCSLLVICKLSSPALWFIVAIFTTVTLVIFVNKISTNKFMSFILFVCLGMFAQSLTIFRQFIALAFVLFAIVQLVDKKWKNASLLIVIGSLFHISAMLCILIVPLRFIKLKWWIVCLLFCGAILGSICFPYALKLLEVLSPLDYYTKYYVLLSQYVHESSLLNTIYTIVLIGLFLMLYIFKVKLLKLEERDMQIYDFFLWIFLFVPLFRVSGFIVNMPEVFHRFNVYFMPILIVLLPLFAKGLQYNKKLFKATNVMIYCCSILYMLYLYGIKNTCGVVPFIFGF